MATVMWGWLPAGPWWSLGRWLTAKEGEDCPDSPRGRWGVCQIKLGENGIDVLLDRLVGDEQLLADGGVVEALSHSGQDLDLSGR